MTVHKKNNFREVRIQSSCGNCRSLFSHGIDGYLGWGCKKTNIHFSPIKLGLPKYFICDEYKRQKKPLWFRFSSSEISIEGTDSGGLTIT